MATTDAESRQLPGGPPWLGPATTRARYDGQWLFVATMMLLAAVTFFGWRALVQVAMVAGGAGMTWLLIGTLRARFGEQSRSSRTRRRALAPEVCPPGRGRGRVALSHVLTLAGLLGLSLPLMLDPWVPLGLGLVLGVLVHAAGRGARMRLNLVALLLVATCFVPAAVYQTELTTMREQFGRPTDAVLRPNHLVIGNAAVADPSAPLVSARRWTDAAGPIDAMRRRDMRLLLSREQRRMLGVSGGTGDRTYLVNLMRGNELAPMKELFLGAVPGPIGGTSPVLLIGLGLYLVYRKLASWRTAAMAFAAAVVTYLLMPIQVTGGIPLFADSEAGVGGWLSEGWLPGGWTVVLDPWLQLGPAAAITFLGYLLLATPWCLVVFILAPLTDPMSRGGRLLYALVLGIGLALCQWWMPVPEGAFVALLVASLLSRPLDAVHRSPFVK